MTKERRHPDPQLRDVLRTNALVSGASGVFATIAATWLGEVMGASPTIVRLVGIGLVLFAVDVALSSAASRERLVVSTRAIGAADVAWVLATVVVVTTGALTAAGVVLAALVGAVVALFAVLEFRGAAALSTRRQTLLPTGS